MNNIVSDIDSGESIVKIINSNYKFIGKDVHDIYRILFFVLRNKPNLEYTSRRILPVYLYCLLS
jgi:hypothetical protein